MMNVAALEYVKSLLQEKAKVPIAFERWNDTLKGKDVWGILEGYVESPLPNKEEDGHHETTLYLRLCTRLDWLTLEQAKEQIEKNCAKTAILPNGNGIAIFYEGATLVPSMDADYKHLKINIQVQEWKVN